MVLGVISPVKVFGWILNSDDRCSGCCRSDTATRMVILTMTLRQWSGIPSKTPIIGSVKLIRVPADEHGNQNMRIVIDGNHLVFFLLLSFVAIMAYHEFSWSFKLCFRDIYCSESDELYLILTQLCSTISSLENPCRPLIYRRSVSLLLINQFVTDGFLGNARDRLRAYFALTCYDWDETLSVYWRIPHACSKFGGILLVFTSCPARNRSRYYIDKELFRWFS